MPPIRRFPLPNDFRKSVLLSRFNLKHPQISGLSWIFFFWKSTTISMVLEFFGLSKFHWIILKIFSGNAGSIELFLLRKKSRANIKCEKMSPFKGLIFNIFSYYLPDFYLITNKFGGCRASPLNGEKEIYGTLYKISQKSI